MLSIIFIIALSHLLFFEKLWQKSWYLVENLQRWPRWKKINNIFDAQSIATIQLFLAEKKVKVEHILNYLL